MLVAVLEAADVAYLNGFIIIRIMILSAIRTCNATAIIEGMISPGANGSTRHGDSFID
jgi:hypothetical protein